MIDAFYLYPLMKSSHGVLKDKLIEVSIIILLIDSLLQLFEGTNIDESILEGNGNIIVFAQELHNLTLAGSL